MLNTIITCVITFLVTSVMGYLLGVARSYKIRDKKQEEALKCLLRSNITSKYYVYSEIGEVPRYERENVNYMWEQYNSMDGNSYVGTIMVDFNKLPVKEK
jgi:hypothetical protein